MICMPMGRPARVKPQGTEIVGRPGKFNGRVLCSMASSLARMVSASPCRSAMREWRHAYGRSDQEIHAIERPAQWCAELGRAGAGSECMWRW